MKIIKYRMLSEINYGTEKQPNIRQLWSDVFRGWSEETEAIAAREAYNGEYEIIDDGEPEPAPSPIDALEAQVAYIGMMTDC